MNYPVEFNPVEPLQSDDAVKGSLILIVDDVPGNLSVLGDLLHDAGYKVKAATSGRAALRYAVQEPQPALILLDVMMPEMDGYQVLSTLRKDDQTRHIPVIFLTALDNARDEERGFQHGAADYIAKPIKPDVVLARVRNQLLARIATNWLRDQNTALEEEVARRMAENELIQAASIRALAHLAETRDPETGNHILRTQGYVRLLASRLQNHARFGDTLTDAYIRMLADSAPLHDIGKVGIPDSVLLKPGKLTAEEWEIMKMHSVLGSMAIEQAERDLAQPVEFLALAKEIAHWHHERWDGKGYPGGRGDPRFRAPDDHLVVNSSGGTVTGVANAVAVIAASTDSVTEIETAISNVVAARAKYGADMATFSSAAAALGTEAVNAAAQYSAVMDTDYAVETTNMLRNQILQQAGSAMLAQANQVPNGVLALLR